jgi:protein gp37
MPTLPFACPDAKAKDTKRPPAAPSQNRPFSRATTGISWTERTWNPVAGCSIASPGCSNCYAAQAAYRLSLNPLTPHYGGTVELAKGIPVWTGKLAAAGDHKWEEPLRRKRATTWFVNSMGDLFHEDLPDEWLARAWDVMERADWHTFQVLTKRPARMLAWTLEHGCPPHVWLGTSVEDQRRADERMPLLVQVPAKVRFVSAEPLLGPVSLAPWLGPNRVSWVIAGCESGPRRRPMQLDWARQLRDECGTAGVSFFFKQAIGNDRRKVELPELDGRQWVAMPGDVA